MASEVSICNQALSWLGANLIISFDDNTDEAQLCKANYALLRDAVLEEGKWAFATRRLKLVLDPDPPPYGYSQKYRVPTDVLVVIEARDNNVATSGNLSIGAAGANGASDLDWRLEENFIVCDSAQLFCKCIVQIVDPKRFTGLFIQSLAARIALELSIPLTESRAKEQTMMVKYDRSIRTALAIDGQQGKRDRLRGRSLLNPR